MCGIVAILGPRTPESVLEAMADRLDHRGPDGEGSWRWSEGDAHLAFGHRRLAIIDLSAAAAQPMLSPDGRLAIIYNGEIYNYIELREELRGHGHVFRTQSDTEVLLAAYAQWGVEFLARLNGMFAFALWDGHERRLLAARDRFGEKPLFFASLASGGIAIASEIKALLAHPAITAAADRDAVRAYVAGAYHESDGLTLFRGIRRLPASHAMLTDANGSELRTWRYWTPDFTVRDEPYSEREAVERFQYLLDRSVAMRLRSDVRVGTSLSGGLDSSAIVAMVARTRDQRGVVSQNTFSARFNDDPTLSEGPYIDLVVESTGVRGWSVSPDPERLIEESRLLHYHQDEPFLSASIYLQWCVMRSARERQTTVILDGQGADELLGGYQPYFRAHQIDLFERGAWIQGLVETSRFTRRLRQAAEQYRQPERRFDPHVAAGILGVVARSARSHLRPGRNAPGLPEDKRGGRFRRTLAEGLLYTSLPRLLRYADRNAMAFGEEVRLPYLDHDLVEFVVGLPDRALVGKGWQKVVLREAVAGLLPHEVAWRSDKVGYAAPLDRWLRGALRSWAHDRVFRGPITRLDEYDRETLIRLWNEHQAGFADRSWQLWRWISLNEWFALLEEGAWASSAPSKPSVAVSK